MSSSSSSRNLSEENPIPRPNLVKTRTSLRDVGNRRVPLRDISNQKTGSSSSSTLLHCSNKIGQSKKAPKPALSGNWNLGNSGPDMNSRGKSHLRPPVNISGSQLPPVESSGSYHSKKVSFDDVLEPQNTSAPPPTNSDGSFESSDDVWLTVSEIPLFTQPTSAPPPARPPPPRPTRPVKKKVNEPSIQSSTNHSHVPSSARASANSPTASQMDELNDFSIGRNQTAANGYPDPPSGDDSDVFSAAVASAAAMKDAMDKAEAKLRHAKERREKENLKASSSREGDHTENYDSRERELREKQVRLDRERVEREAEIEKAQDREREEGEREQKRIELERERLLARQAVERATREARDRAATEAHAKKQPLKHVKEQKRIERERERLLARQAVERATREARERAATEAHAKKQPLKHAKEQKKIEKGKDCWLDRLQRGLQGKHAKGQSLKHAKGQSLKHAKGGRRRARLERHQRTEERAAKALAEKNERDLQLQREQAEKDRIRVTLDVEVKRWGADREGNLRALLSTLQYVRRIAINEATLSDKTSLQN